MSQLRRIRRNQAPKKPKSRPLPPLFKDDLVPKLREAELRFASHQERILEEARYMGRAAGMTHDSAQHLMDLLLERRGPGVLVVENETDATFRRQLEQALHDLGFTHHIGDPKGPKDEGFSIIVAPDGGQAG